MNVTLYVGNDCPLCDEALLNLKLAAEDFPLDVEVVDIKQDDQLHEKYMLMIPVLEKDGQVLLYGNIGYGDVMEALL
ncbi:Glutaredoxin-like domain [Bhargavaea ginsengi]|uniref:Glutaredoxin-like domain n=1 Tax=Bhargavaea ginsengi TaxID=426757 RepID=A0A1H7C1U5_9BACL|nr:glutaredoxin family protein [Bhargavaea ginsengi]SEJ82537.1 Glutaredoxin-like domain [Bhargavaea ginsengi]